ncbi:hypothetical protein [Streptomyces sp. NPDC003393]
MDQKVSVACEHPRLLRRLLAMAVQKVGSSQSRVLFDGSPVIRPVFPVAPQPAGKVLGSVAAPAAPQVQNAAACAGLRSSEPGAMGGLSRPVGRGRLAAGVRRSGPGRYRAYVSRVIPVSVTAISRAAALAAVQGCETLDLRHIDLPCPFLVRTSIPIE